MSASKMAACNSLYPPTIYNPDTRICQASAKISNIHEVFWSHGDEGSFHICQGGYLFGLHGSKVRKKSRHISSNPAYHTFYHFTTIFSQKQITLTKPCKYCSSNNVSCYCIEMGKFVEESEVIFTGVWCLAGTWQVAQSPGDA